MRSQAWSIFFIICQVFAFTLPNTYSLFFLRTFSKKEKMWRYALSIFVGALICAIVLSILFTGSLVNSFTFDRLSCRLHKGSLSQTQLIPKNIPHVEDGTTASHFPDCVGVYCDPQPRVRADTVHRRDGASVYAFFYGRICKKAYDMLVPGPPRRSVEILSPLRVRWCLSGREERSRSFEKSHTKKR